MTLKPVCDRCRRVSESSQNLKFDKIEYDLCARCAEDFRTWLHRKGGFGIPLLDRR